MVCPIIKITLRFNKIEFNYLALIEFDYSLRKIELISNKK